MASDSAAGDFCFTTKREVNKPGGLHRKEFVMNFSPEGSHDRSVSTWNFGTVSAFP